MREMGLCNTCITNGDCVFQKGVVVLQCEEFSDYHPAHKVNSLKNHKYQECGPVATEETTESFD